jgi:hypothetical protein
MLDPPESDVVRFLPMGRRVTSGPGAITLFKFNGLAVGDESPQGQSTSVP